MVKSDIQNEINKCVSQVTALFGRLCGLCDRLSNTTEPVNELEQSPDLRVIEGGKSDQNLTQKLRGI